MAGGLMQKPKKMREAESRIEEDLVSFLARRLNKGAVHRELAVELGVSKATLHLWALRLGIKKTFIYDA